MERQRAGRTQPAKLQAMHEEAGETPLGIASGITPDNVRAYTPYVTWFLVASGISVDFHNLSPELVKSLNDLSIATEHNNLSRYKNK